MKRHLDGQVVCITGAASGIGRALAELCAGEGAELILLDIHKAGLETAAQEITAAWSASVTPLVCDLSDTRQVQSVSEEVLAQADVLINNAGVGSYGQFVERSFDEFQYITQVNYLAVVQLTKRYLDARGLSQASAIVNFASLIGLIELPFMSAYCASKFAVSAFTRCLRLELATAPVHIMTVYPGPVRTNFGRQYGYYVDFDDPKNRRTHLPPERIAQAVVKGLLSGRKTVIVPGYLAVAVVIRNTFPRFYDLISLRLGRSVLRKGLK
jgi:short-subunit dehydrogenase